jgi:hypothetical protein
LIKDHNVQLETLKLEENIREILQDRSIGNNFLDRFSVAKEKQKKINKWNHHIKLKSFCTAKEIITRDSLCS